VVTSGDKFKLEISNGSHTLEVANGPLYVSLRILISRITINSRSTTSYIQKSLSEINDYMASIDYNITTFNGFVRLQMDALNARGETSSNILNKVKPSHTVELMHITKMARQKNRFEIYKKGLES